jgi:CDP-diacylglycerol---glycerol-3-phosphate 3-phosphatidyltransferase
VDRISLLAPALLLLATLLIAFVVYCGLCAAGRPPEIKGAKHNQLLGPFFARYIVWLIGPLERLLVGRVSPNLITALSLAMCAWAGVEAGLGALGGAAWIFGLAGILDVLDGRLARLANRQTKSGALFDSVSDRWGELFVFSGYAWYLHDTPWMLAVMGAIGSSMMVSYTRARAEGLGLELSGGMMQRAERIILVTVGSFCAAWFAADPETAWVTEPILGGTMIVCAVASTATAVSRWILAFRELARRDAAALQAVAVPAAASAQPQPAPHFKAPAPAPIPAKLRESAELGL